MQKIYVGVNGTPREVVKVLVGVNGTPREVTQVYVGSNGTPRLSYQNKTKAGEKVFTSSGKFTVPKGIDKIDIFCVGGGADGSSGSMFNSTGGYGGGSGYTKTVISASVAPGQVLSVAVGSSSGNTSVGQICTAAGGSSENGGSGGGAFGNFSAHQSIASAPGNGGSNGSNGGNSWKLNHSSVSSFGGKGQGTTTRYFGESNGTLYAGGGGGGSGTIGSYAGYGGSGGGGKGAAAGLWGSADPGTYGTGSGGGGGSGHAAASSSGGSGGAGVAIIRWPDEA